MLVILRVGGRRVSSLSVPLWSFYMKAKVSGIGFMAHILHQNWGKILSIVDRSFILRVSPLDMAKSAFRNLVEMTWEWSRVRRPEVLPLPTFRLTLQVGEYVTEEVSFELDARPPDYAELVKNTRTRLRVRVQEIVPEETVKKAVSMLCEISGKRVREEISWMSVRDYIKMLYRLWKDLEESGLEKEASIWVRKCLLLPPTGKAIKEFLARCLNEWSANRVAES